MRTIGRVLGLVLLGWLGTISVAATMAMQKKREAPAAPPDPSADEVDLRAIFESLEFTSTATAFRGGTIECWFGGGSVDLRGATLDPAGATLRVRAIFGGASIRRAYTARHAM